MRKDDCTMRVITGTARGRKLTPPQDNNIRPTSDMVKEAVFSIVNFEIEGARVLDLFAGCGQMGIEAISRGASVATFVDSSRKAANLVTENLKSTQLIDSARVVFMDYKAFLATTDQTFDIVFIDPPYEKGMAQEALPLVAPLMNQNGVIICETDKKEEMPAEAGHYKFYREYKYGKIKLTVYRDSREEV